jgi:putative DNA primase/helicase
MNCLATKYDPVEFDKLWSSIKPGNVGMGTLFHHAKENGWVDPGTVAAASQETKDLLNAKGFAEANVDRLLFIHETGAPLQFSSPEGWVRADIGAADTAAKAVIKNFYAEAAELFKQAHDSADATKLLKHASYSSTAQRIDAMIKLARSEPGMSVRMADFDADPNLLGVQNGVLDLKHVRLQPVQPSTLVSKRASVAFHPMATCPRFETFLATVQPNAVMRGFLQQLAGIWLAGDVNLQKFVFFYGSGANGKSTFMELLAWLLGDYSLRIQTEMLMQHQRNPQGPSADYVSLQGRRMVYCNEVDEGRRLAESRVKEMTGGDTLSGRAPHAQEGITFQPTHTLVMIGNHMPEVRGTDEGIWRRMLIVPFDQAIPEANQDRELLSKLKGEGSGVLNWALAGLRDYRNNGLQIPPSVRAATDAYRTDQDIIGDWITDKCNVIAGAATEKGSLYANYQNWARDHGHHPFAQTRFTRNLTGRGHTLDGGRRKIAGLELKPMIGMVNFGQIVP